MLFRDFLTLNGKQLEEYINSLEPTKWNSKCTKLLEIASEKGESVSTWQMAAHLLDLEDIHFLHRIRWDKLRVIKKSRPPITDVAFNQNLDTIYITGLFRNGIRNIGRIYLMGGKYSHTVWVTQTGHIQTIYGGMKTMIKFYLHEEWKQV